AVQFRNRIPGIAGMSTGIATLTKIFPALLVLYFAVTRRWRACAWSLAAILVLSILGVTVMGWTPHSVFVTEVLPRVARGEILDPYNVRYNALQTLVHRAFVTEAGLNPHPIFN